MEITFRRLIFYCFVILLSLVELNQVKAQSQILKDKLEIYKQCIRAKINEGKMYLKEVPVVVNHDSTVFQKPETFSYVFSSATPYYFQSCLNKGLFSIKIKDKMGNVIGDNSEFAGADIMLNFRSTDIYYLEFEYDSTQNINGHVILYMIKDEDSGSGEG